MSTEPVFHYKDNRQPPLSGVIELDGTPVNLTGSTVKLQMRAVGTVTPLKIDAAAVITDAVNGAVRYDFAALDVDTVDFYVAWWRVTLASGQFEDTPEFLFEVRAHAPVTNQYVSVEELKDALTLSGESYADADIARALAASSNVVDELCQTSFAQVTATRKFTPVGANYLRTGPLSAITALTNDAVAWTEGTNYFIDGGDTLRTLFGYTFSRAPQAVSISATFGVSPVPGEIKEAVQIIAVQVLRRVREAPFGILATAVDGPAIRLRGFDPQVDQLLLRWKVTPMIE
jgi:hypothetical protein